MIFGASSKRNSAWTDPNRNWSNKQRHQWPWGSGHMHTIYLLDSSAIGSSKLDAVP